ncbi:hypothetical protein HYC85_016856 [Camellia sinensis]|uniref:Uncharacterized protein n=1 Tax=Camellia sinensis TaxID=4442 RepID=A0A7J7H4H9_CAMSI|nr:hypothetical protein HYC85_016856 [Camellia sinensis]
MGKNEEVEEERMEGGVVVVKPKPNKGLTSTVIDWLEKLIVKLMYDTSQPHHYLAGNFGPVHDETPPCKDLTIQGYLPECLNGEFVRVGPNPKFTPVAGYHWKLQNFPTYLAPLSHLKIHILSLSFTTYLCMCLFLVVG